METNVKKENRNKIRKKKYSVRARGERKNEGGGRKNGVRGKGEKRMK